MFERKPSNGFFFFFFCILHLGIVSSTKQLHNSHSSLAKKWCGYSLLYTRWRSNIFYGHSKGWQNYSQWENHLLFTIIKVGKNELEHRKQKDI